jgi:PBSX family phage terminase large subunit
MEYAVVELRKGEAGGFCPRGGAARLWRSRGHEVMLSGPSETGKTFSCLHKLDALLWKYPRARAVIVRKTLSSLYPSVLQTYRNVLGPEPAVDFYGGQKPEWADYPNGSRVYFAGMDNPQKALSSERDFIYVNQAEELSLNDWETLTTRCTGRAANAPYSQIFGDCNPGPPAHWIRHRPSLEFFESRHEDNPTLFDEAGEITERGTRTLEILDRLTGVRKARLRFGKWVQAEGVIYEGWDANVHHIDPFPIPPGWRRIRSVDFGHTNPFVCLWVAIDGDGRMYVYRQIYHTKRTVKVHSGDINRLSSGETFDFTVADHDAGERATLQENGITTVAAIKDVLPGIEAVQERLKEAEDGRPRLFVLRGSLAERDKALAEVRRPCSLADEMDVYVWKKTADGAPAKDAPAKENDHAQDALRYAVMAVDRGVPGWGTMVAMDDPFDDGERI